MFEAEIDDYQGTRSLTLDLVKDLSQEQMDLAPGSGQWSAGQLLDHILASDRLLQRELSELIDLKRSGRRPYLDRVISEFPLSLDFLPQPLLPLLHCSMSLINTFSPQFLVDALLRYPLLPAQAPAVLAPRQGRPAAKLRQELRASFKKTRALFEDNRDLDFRQLLFHHPLLGLTDAIGLARGIKVHEQRHQAQLRQILESVAADALTQSKHSRQRSQTKP